MGESPVREAGTDSRAPRLDSEAFDCPRCGAYAHQRWQTLQRSVPMGTSTFFDSEKGKVSASTWRASTCSRCNESSVWRADRMVFPTSGVVAVPHADMPDTARELYDEAREVAGISRRAGAALARATLERLLKVLDPQAGSVALDKRIGRILPRVSEPLGQLLTVIRHVGNKSLHVPDQPDEILVFVLDEENGQVMELLFEAINDLVDELITRPARSKSLYDRVPEGVRQAVERAKGQS